MPSRRTLLRATGGIALATGTVGLGAGSANATGPGTNWGRLRNQLHGDLVLPGNSGYDLAKQLEVAQYDAVNPQGIAYCETPGDVSACVRFAKHYEIPVRVRSGGHNHSGWSTSEGLVIDVSRINHATVGRSTIHLGPGLEAVDAVNALKPYNKQVISGTCGTVCLGGFLSGGGIGYHTRKFGIGSDRVVSARLVLADGRLVHCSPDEEPDLYWAIRGGGGNNFGVVVDFEVAPVEAPTAVTYTTTWPADKMQQVIAEWQAWCVAGSNSLGSLLAVLPPFFGSPTVLITGLYLGPKAELDAALDELAGRVGVQPLTRDVSGQLPYADAATTNYCGDKTLLQCHRVGHNPEAQMPRAPWERQSFQLINRALTAEEVGRYVAAWERHPELPYRYLQCIAIGGVANHIPRASSAWWQRDARFLIGYICGQDSSAPSDEQVAQATAWTDEGAAVLAQFASGSYINFPSARPVADWQHSTFGDHYSRLVRIKHRYDPTNFFRYPQSIGS
ncbi:FAD-dependent oxidoreductase [Dactylosporangium sp. NPDC048998]|uniref:FAD-dependent oxidoreductase n=1 Tax=Dactylosporangium sp. NPDC048998 TaxID=3363976 RepID=UPI0037119D7B